MSSLESFCYVGQCPVCEESCDQEDSGVCHYCAEPFCWSNCGTWRDLPEGGREHVCDRCAEERKLEEE